MWHRTKQAGAGSAERFPVACVLALKGYLDSTGPGKAGAGAAGRGGLVRCVR